MRHLEAKQKERSSEMLAELEATISWSWVWQEHSPPSSSPSISGRESTRNWMRTKSLYGGIKASFRDQGL